MQREDGVGAALSEARKRFEQAALWGDGERRPESAQINLSICSASRPDRDDIKHSRIRISLRTTTVADDGELAAAPAVPIILDSHGATRRRYRP